MKTALRILDEHLDQLDDLARHGVPDCNCKLCHPGEDTDKEDSSWLARCAANLEGEIAQFWAVLDEDVENTTAYQRRSRQMKPCLSIHEMGVNSLTGLSHYSLVQNGPVAYLQTDDPTLPALFANAESMLDLLKSAVSLWGFMRNDLVHSRNERDAAHRKYQEGNIILNQIELNQPMI